MKKRILCLLLCLVMVLSLLPGAVFAAGNTDIPVTAAVDPTSYAAAVSWSSVAGADHYEVRLMRYSPSDGLYLQSGTLKRITGAENCTFTADYFAQSNIPGADDWQVSVWAIDANGALIARGESKNFSVNMPRLAEPKPVLEPNGVVQWDAVPNAGEYAVILKDQSLHTVANAVIDKTSFDFSGEMKEKSVYRCDVYAMDTNNRHLASYTASSAWVTYKPYCKITYPNVSGISAGPFTVAYGSEYTIPTPSIYPCPKGTEYSNKWSLTGDWLPNGYAEYPGGSTVVIKGDTTLFPVWHYTRLNMKAENMDLDDNRCLVLASGKKLSDVIVRLNDYETAKVSVNDYFWLENDRTADPNLETLKPNSRYTLIITLQRSPAAYELTADTELVLYIGGTCVTARYVGSVGSSLVDFSVDFTTACAHISDGDWSKDSGYHWHECAICGAALDKAEHTWNSGTVNGNRTTYTCTACGETRTESNDNKQVGSLYIDLGTVVSGAAVPEVTSFRYPGDNGKASMTTVRFRKGNLNVNPGAFFEYRTTYTVSTTITSKSGYYFSEGSLPTSVYFYINGEAVKATITFRSQNEIVATYHVKVQEAPTVEMRFPNGIHGGDDLIAKLAECAFVYNGTAQDLMVIASKDGELLAVNTYMDGAWLYTDVDTLIAENFQDITPEEIAAYRELMTVQSGSTYGFILAPLSSMAIGRTIPEKLTITANGAVSVTPNEDGSFGAVAIYTAPYATVTHTVTFQMNGHGEAQSAQTILDGARAKRPTDPTAAGYTFGGWYADAALTQTFDFSTPICADTTIYAKWTEAKDCGGDPDNCPLSQFTDAPGYSNWAHKGIEYCVRNGLMSGTSATTFSPKTAMSRAMLVTVLYRMDGQPGAGSTKFSDVPAGQWYSAAVSWAADHGIVSGVGEGKFNPNGNVSREQIATILYRYAGYKGCDTSKKDNLSGFADAASVGKWFVDGMKWAVAEGLISGTAMNGKTYLSPQGDATREQVAAILMRFCENVAE